MGLVVVVFTSFRRARCRHGETRVCQIITHTVNYCEFNFIDMKNITETETRQQYSTEEDKEIILNYLT